MDWRSDIFSFGCVLYEMVTGRPAFLKDTGFATLAAVKSSDATAVSQPVKGLPRDIQRLILLCLRKDPAKRIQSAHDLKIALEDLNRESD